ncbi:MAG TPA: AraC family transcriptional regulator ligand-binding domain-containing protein [Fontimonas sp.]
MNAEHFYSLEGPLDSMPVERQIRAANLSGFGDRVRELGGEPRSMLDRHGIDARALRDPDAYIDSRAVVELLEDCSRTFKDPLFGLRLAQHQEPEVFGAVATLCRSAASVREALNGFVDFIPVVHCPLVELELVEGQELAELRWRIRTDIGQADQAQHKGALMNMKLLRQIGGHAFKPRSIQLTVDPRKVDADDVARRYGCAFQGRTKTNVIAFPKAVLDQSVPSANRLLFKLLGGYLDRVRGAARRSTVERVEDYVRGALSSGHCSIEQCAKKLGIPVRTLQSSLSSKGLRFSDIVERQRIELAKNHLERGELAIDDLAALLGYAEQSSFGRAFKRWTGATPQGFRRELKLRAAA